MKIANILTNWVPSETLFEGTPCWLWQNHTTDKGYGTVAHNGKMYKVHRLAYRLLRGDIPVGLTIDHRCEVKACFNPRHLEPVTNRVNILRSSRTRASINANKTECLRGHPYDEKNTYLDAKGTRYCKACDRIRKKMPVAIQKRKIRQAKRRQTKTYQDYMVAWRLARKQQRGNS